MSKLQTVFWDWREQISWGRFCAAVSLVVAVWREFTGAAIEHVALWLAVATGSYVTSKVTEIVALLKRVRAAVLPAPGGESVAEPMGCVHTADRPCAGTS